MAGKRGTRDVRGRPKSTSELRTIPELRERRCAVEQALLQLRRFSSAWRGRISGAQPTCVPESTDAQHSEISSLERSLLLISATRLWGMCAYFRGETPREAEDLTAAATSVQTETRGRRYSTEPGLQPQG
jgi:hypothetical protein